MMFDINSFPSLPALKGVWQAIQIEPIIGSGERITVAISAIAENREFKIIKSVRNELLDTFYGNKAANIDSMIELLMKSAQQEITLSGSLAQWIAPLEGINITPPRPTYANDITGILRQAIQFSSSFSALSLSAERDDENISQELKAEEKRWSKKIQQEVINRKESTKDCFSIQYQLGSSAVKTKFSFMNTAYASNFGLFSPHKPSQNVFSIKSKIFDLDRLNTFHITPQKTELILGSPEFESDPTLSERSIRKAQEYLLMFEEIAEEHKISVFRAKNHIIAANRILTMAA